MKKILLISLIFFLGSFTLFSQMTGARTGIDFSGGDKNVEFPDDPSLNPTIQISVEAWINSFSWGINAWTNNIVNKEDWAVVQEGYTLRCGDNGKVSFMFSGGGVWRELITPAVLQLNTWYHVVGTFDGDSINVYVNGEYIGTQLYSGPMTPGSYPLRIGMISYTPGGSRAFDGIIDEVRIWNTALDISTIRDWMCKKITPAHPDYANLIAYFKLDEGSGTTVHDSSPNNNTGTFNGGPTWVNSGALIGDNSVNSYSAPYNLSLNYNNADSMVVSNVAGNPTGIQLVSFDGSQNALNYPATYNGIDTSHYWGVLMFGGTSPSYDLTYYYGGGSLSGACGLGMLGRMDNSVMVWNDLNAAHNISVQTLSKNLTTRQEISIGFTGAANIFTSDPKTFCDGDSAVLIADSALSYQWLKDGAAINGANNNSYTATATGDYSLVAVVGTCIDTSQVITITVYPVPIANAGPDKTICPGANVSLTASGGVAYVWSTNPPQTTPTILVHPTSETTYYVTVVQNICTDVDTVTVYMAPLVYLGSDTTINPGSTLILDPGPNYLSYLWSDGSSGQYLTVSASGTYWVQTTYPGGCVSSDTIVVYVGYRIFGEINYANSNITPINNTMLMLTDDVGNKMDSVVTGANGDYLFANLSNGDYYTVTQCSKPWGGVNSTDALAVMKHFVGIIYLYGIYRDAGDVNQTQYVNSADALMIQQRYLGMVTAFPAGDWLFQNDLIPLWGVNIQNDIKGVCFGDVNGSYTPPLTKQVPTLFMEEKGELEVANNNIIKVPIRISSEADVAAISLEMIFDKDKIEIIDVNLEKNSDEKLMFNVIDDTLRISWYSLESIICQDGDILLTIELKLKLYNPDDENIEFQLGSSSELSGPDLQVINDVDLSYPKIKSQNNSFENFLGYNHPNPFSAHTKIDYSVADNGSMVKLSIINVLGEELVVLVDRLHENGKYHVNFNASDLPKGYYFYNITISGQGSNYSKTRSLQIN